MPICSTDPSQRSGVKHVSKTDWQLSELCQALTERGFRTVLEGPDLAVRAVNTLGEASRGEMSFLANPRYRAELGRTKASAVLLAPGVDGPPSVSVLRCADPYVAMTVAILLLHGQRGHPQWGISDRAHIAASARVGSNANIGPFVTVAENVSIGDRCTIYPGCYLADGTSIGHDCTLFPNVVIYDGCVLGNRVTVHANSVIGEDGLGYAPHDGKWIKIPQAGRAIIGDDVEIGANCAVDRATLGETHVGAGSKFGNAVVIGHGVKVGPDCLFVGQVGVAGSARIGRHVTLAGQVGVGGHLTLGDETKVSAQSGVRHSTPPAATVMGSPAMDAPLARRSSAALAKLPEWIRRVKQLELQIEQLREELARCRS